MNDPFRLPGYVIIVGNEHNGVARAVKFPENLHNFRTGFGIQIACRLIGKNQAGTGHNGPGDGYPLLLTAGKLRRQVLCRFCSSIRLRAASTRSFRSARGTP